MKKPIYVFDSFALLAYFQAEPGGAKVKELLQKASAGSIRAFLSTLNLGEIIYITERRLGVKTADTILEDILHHLPVQLAEASLDRVMAAAHIKARYAVSYADAFVVSLAKELKATVVTSDPEFKKVESQIKILWI